MLEVEPPGPPDRSELGLLGGVLGAGSEHWSCGPAVGSEVHVNPAHLAVTHFHKAQAGISQLQAHSWLSSGLEAGTSDDFVQFLGGAFDG